MCTEFVQGVLMSSLTGVMPECLYLQILMLALFFKYKWLQQHEGWIWNITQKGL